MDELLGYIAEHLFYVGGLGIGLVLTVEGQANALNSYQLPQYVEQVGIVNTLLLDSRPI